MIPELGHVALILALGMSVLLAIVPLVGAARGNQLWMNYARSLAWGQFFFLLLALFALVHAFVTDDFSVAYVANNSNSLMPVQFKVSAVWGAHEGSLLLWGVILSGWTFAVSLFSRNLPLDMVARVLAVMGMIAVGFLLFMTLTSNPFERFLPDSPMDGADLNPLLQDVGLIVHPPMLYMGYVGFSVAFAFAVAALLGGRLDSAWARWSRPWTNIAWVFLSIGIVLGSYWAYYELGWGGWWFWDPVENASFMPWLVGTALMHSLAVTDKRGLFKNWTLLLAIFAFSLSLLGTFLVRSGVLTSVHAFANDPARGLFILIFLAIVIGGSLTLYALRVPRSNTPPGFGAWSRELMLLLNNVILVTAAGTVLLGTLAPLIVSAFGGRISVGAPYFNLMFVPLMCLLALALGFAPACHWQRSSRSYILRQVMVAGIAAALIGLLLPLVFAGEFSFGGTLATLLACWIVATGFADFRSKWQRAGRRVRGFSRSYWGMQLGHLGVAVCIIGVAYSAIYSDQRDVRLAPGDTVELAGYRFQFEGMEQVKGPNYVAEQADVSVFRGTEKLYSLYPQKRKYLAKGQTMTEAAIDTGFTRDLYVSLGEPLDNGAWAMRVYYKAFIDWIWVGGLIMALGGLTAVTDRRYRLKSRASDLDPQAGGAQAKA